MPELPEVETVLRTLEKQIKGRCIKDIDIYYENMIEHVDVPTFYQTLKNETFKDFHRIGKYMVFELHAVYLIVHLRMEGKFYIQDKDSARDKHTHIIFTLDDGRTLRYHDTRKFGRMYVYDKTLSYEQLPVFNNVGKDAFDETLGYMDLYRISRKKNTTIKQFLLDQHYIAGIGNIYADEICFACHLHPKTRINKLSKKDFENIVYETRRILNGAIKAGGTTIRSYTSSLEVDGRFQLKLKVHARKDEHCYVCDSVIEKIKIGGRGTYFCRTCQKRK